MDSSHASAAHRLPGGSGWVALLLAIGAALFGGATIQAADAAKPVTDLRGLIIVKSKSEITPGGAADVSGLVVKDIPLLDGADFKSRINPFFGKPIDDKLLKDLPQAVIAYCREKGQPLVDAGFGPQSVTNGVLQLFLVQGKLGRVVYEGANRWSREAYTRENLHLAPGQPIDAEQLDSDVAWLNRGKFHSVETLVRPGAAEAESDLVVRMHDRFPLSAFVGIDTDGTRITGENRFSTGIEWGNFLWLDDHYFTYRYTADTDFRFLEGHSVTYEFPLPWRHIVRLSGTYSSVRADLPGTLTGITTSGTSYGANLRYIINLPKLRAYTHQLSLGADYNRSDNNLEFNFLNFSASTVDTEQLVIGYSGTLPDAWGGTSVGIEYYYSPGNLTSLNGDAAFRASYANAKANYNYARFNVERLTRIPGGLTWRAFGLYQWADGDLLPSAQLGLGGVDTVRGYDERTVNGSEGYYIINELYSPSFSLGGLLDATAKDQLQLLGFFDYGETGNPVLLPNERSRVTLMSAGVGMRYQVAPYVSVRFDYGWQLKDPPASILISPETSRAHVSARITF